MAFITHKLLKEMEATNYSSELPFPQLVILEHTSLAQEKFAKNGVQKNVHVVVKNTPFHITVGFANLMPHADLNFNIVTAEVLLMYDCDGDRFVDFIKDKPLEYKGSMSDAGDKMTMEIRLKKLSSHLEDMFFKIRIKGVDSRTHEDIPYLSVTSQPIKVVSKPEQVARIKQKQNGEKVVKKPRTKKRSLNEMMLESMEKLQKQQEEHKSLLEEILRNKSETNNNNCADDLLSDCKKAKAMDLEEAIQNLLVAYENTKPTERPLKIRKILSNTNPSNMSNLVEISSQLLYSQNKGHTNNGSNYFAEVPAMDQTSIADNLAISDDVDDFYRQFLLPSSF